MTRRISMFMDDDIDKKVRLIQAKWVFLSSSNSGYSRVINNILRKALN